MLKDIMAKSEVQSELRWNVKSEENPETHEWFLLLINRLDRINRIRQKFIENTYPIDEIRTRYQGRVPNSRLAYRLITCKTFTIGPHNVPWRAIYQGLVSRDEKLYERRNDGLLDYVESLIKDRSNQSLIPAK